MLTVTKPEQAHWVFDEDPDDEPDYDIVKMLWNARIVPVPVANTGTAASSSSGTWGSNTASLPPPHQTWL